MINNKGLKMILIEDLEKEVQKYDDKIYNCVKLITPYDSLKVYYDECIKNLFELYELYDKDKFLKF